MHRKSILLLVSIISLSSLVGGQAQAESHLSAVGGGQLREASHHLDIELGSELASVSETLTLANLGPGPSEGLYSFELPRRAAIWNLSIETQGQTTVFGVVGAGASTRLVADPTEDAKADVGLLRMIALDQDTSRGANRRYELRVYPIPGKASTIVTIDYQVPVTQSGGVTSLHLPERGSSPKLARTQVTVAAPRASSLHGGGKRLSAKAIRGKKYNFFAPAKGALIIEARQPKGGSKASAQVALMPLSATSGIAAVMVTVPDAAARPVTGFDRAILIVDVSKSMGEAGRKAARRFTDSVLTELGSATMVETIVYDRNASRVLGRMRKGERSVRTAIDLAINGAPGNNGSNLAGALSLTREVLAELGQSQPGRTLIVIVTDGMLPTGLSVDDALKSLGKAAVAQSKVLVAVLVPENAPLPDLQGNSVFALASRAQGRTLRLRHGEVQTQSKQILSVLGQPAPMDTIEVELDRGTWVGADFPSSVTAGSSAIALGYYEGGVPRRVTVIGLQDGKRVSIKAKTMNKTKTLSFARMTLADSASDSFPGDDDPRLNKTAFLRAASTLKVVTEASAGVALLASDGFGQDRLRLAKRWGGAYYRRLAPAPERVAKAGFQTFRLRTRSTAKTRTKGRTGQLDPEIISRRIKAHVIPPSRGCYNHLLRRNQKATGALTLHIEVARGEVQFAEILSVPPELAPISVCILDAVYAMPIPKVGLGVDPELINIALYPLRFRPQTKGRGNIEQGRYRELTQEEFSDPLFGLPE